MPHTTELRLELRGERMNEKQEVARVPLVSVEMALAQNIRVVTRLIVALVISAGLQFAAWSVALATKNKRGSK